MEQQKKKEGKLAENDVDVHENLTETMVGTFLFEPGIVANEMKLNDLDDTNSKNS